MALTPTSFPSFKDSSAQGFSQRNPEGLSLEELQQEFAGALTEEDREVILEAWVNKHLRKAIENRDLHSYPYALGGANLLLQINFFDFNLLSEEPPRLLNCNTLDDCKGKCSWINALDEYAFAKWLGNADSYSINVLLPHFVLLFSLGSIEDMEMSPYWEKHCDFGVRLINEALLIKNGEQLDRNINLPELWSMIDRLVRCADVQDRDRESKNRPIKFREILEKVSALVNAAQYRHYFYHEIPSAVERALGKYSGPAACIVNSELQGVEPVRTDARPEQIETPAQKFCTELASICLPLWQEDQQQYDLSHISVIFDPLTMLLLRPEHKNWQEKDRQDILTYLKSDPIGAIIEKIDESAAKADFIHWQYLILMGMINYLLKPAPEYEARGALHVGRVMNSAPKKDPIRLQARSFLRIHSEDLLKQAKEGFLRGSTQHAIWYARAAWFGNRTKTTNKIQKLCLAKYHAAHLKDNEKNKEALAKAHFTLGCAYSDNSFDWIPFNRELAKDCFSRAKQLGHSQTQEKIDQLSKDPFDDSIERSESRQQEEPLPTLQTVPPPSLDLSARPRAAMPKLYRIYVTFADRAGWASDIPNREGMARVLFDGNTEEWVEIEKQYLEEPSSGSPRGSTGSPAVSPLVSPSGEISSLRRNSIVDHSFEQGDTVYCEDCKPEDDIGKITEVLGNDFFRVKFEDQTLVAHKDSLLPWSWSY
ncbi:MAG: hypothetical protein WB791_04060 [Waddliaceae bacterium]